MALDRRSGKVLWNHTVCAAWPHESSHQDRTPASSSPIHDGELALSVTISPTPPEPDRSYDRIVELSCRFGTGHAVLHELAGRKLPLPPLPAGHGDYRLRFHTKPSGCLVQIWNQPRTKPNILR